MPFRFKTLRVVHSLEEDQARGYSRRRNKKIGLGSLIDLVSGSVELRKPSKFKQAVHFCLTLRWWHSCTLCMTRDKPRGPLLPLVLEIERLFHQRRSEKKTQRATHRGEEPVDGEENRNAAALARPRAIRDHLTPILDDLNLGIVAPEIQAASVMFNMLNLIGQFGGSLHEDARQHICAFLEVCDSFQQGVHEDV
ncbi:hypothetical protein GQ457_06G011480 [Hibiscus cannabinus]